MKKKPQTRVYDEEVMDTVLAVFEEIINTLRKNQITESHYYDSADVKRLLNISDSTLFRIRKSENIPHIKIGRKIFYPKSFFTTALRK